MGRGYDRTEMGDRLIVVVSCADGKDVRRYTLSLHCIGCGVKKFCVYTLLRLYRAIFLAGLE